MKKDTLLQNKLPDGPGIYLFKKGKSILYVGKATSLKDRVKSYFAKDIAEVRSSLIAQMVEEATGIDYEQTDSVLEALMREVALIKKYQPKYNTREKDNKSFNYVVITQEDYPRVLLVRGRELMLNWEESDIKYLFGPFPHGGQLKEALKLIRKIFPFRGKTDPIKKTKRKVSRLNEELGLAPAFGSGEVSQREYAKTIRNLKLFFEGKKKKLVTTLEKEMRVCAHTEQFEKAETRKRQLFALEHINDVALIKEKTMGHSSGFRIEAYDVAHIAETDRVGVMVVVEDGHAQKNEYKKFKIKRVESKGDTGALYEILDRRLTHNEWQLPNMIIVDGTKQQKTVAEKALKEYGYSIPVIAVTKDEKHRPKSFLGDTVLIQKHEKAILFANAEAHRFALAYHRLRRSKKISS